MKLLHTSDWHLGRTLYGKKRYAEFEAFLTWLIQTIRSEKPDILLIAGDVFDTTTPSNRSQELYYQFLCEVATSTPCQHIVIIGGNHDSPTLLNAPQQILRHLEIHVAGCITNNPEDEVLLLKDKVGNELAYICAVPYLRDRDIRSVEAGEAVADKQQKLVTGIREHYACVCAIAGEQRRQLGKDIPIIGMGHLFTNGGMTERDDGVRELYVGSLARVASSDFPANIDYLALGHLHVPQMVAKQEHMRYSGSPIAMGFGEANQEKIILSVEFQNSSPQVTAIPVPKFQQMARIKGDLGHIEIQLYNMVKQQQNIWVEVNYTGDKIVADLNQRLQTLVQGSQVELLRIFNRPMLEQITTANNGYADAIEDLTPDEVFKRCLSSFEVPEAQHAELVAGFDEIVAGLHNADSRAE